jgi:CheY-like chemotaxis protein
MTPPMPTSRPDEDEDEDEAPQSNPGPQQESLEAIARLVAHAINNPLAALVMDLDMAQEVLQGATGPSDLSARAEEAQKLLFEARRAADRLHAVVENLRKSTTAADAVRVLTTVPPFVPSQDAGRESGRPARVLVVDDDLLVARAVKRSLRSHDVVALASGRDALARLEAGERFDVILCDLIMPDITGMDLHEALARLAPDQARRMVFVTGGAITTRARDFVATTRNEVVEKPFDVAKLRDVVQRHMQCQGK